MGGWLAYILNNLGGGTPVILPVTLLEAMRTRILNAASMSALASEVYNRKTPAKGRIGFPCCVLNVITEETPEMFTGGDFYGSSVEVQVTILDTDEYEGMSIRDAAYKLFGPKTTPLAFTDGTTWGPVPGRKWDWDQPGNGPNGATVWASAFRVTFFVTRTYL